MPLWGSSRYLARLVVPDKVRNMARFIGIDVGTRKIGLAIADEDSSFAVPSDVIDALGAPTAVSKRILEEDFIVVVIGLPVDQKGKEGPAAKRSRTFALLLERAMVKDGCSAAIEFVDERLTTVIAHHLLSEAGMKGKKQKEQVDAVAAQQILQAYLDNVRNGAADGE